MVGQSGGAIRGEIVIVAMPALQFLQTEHAIWKPLVEDPVRLGGLGALDKPSVALEQQE